MVHITLIALLIFITFMIIADIICIAYICDDKNTAEEKLTGYPILIFCSLLTAVLIMSFCSLVSFTNGLL